MSQKLCKERLVKIFRIWNEEEGEGKVKGEEEQTDESIIDNKERIIFND